MEKSEYIPVDTIREIIFQKSGIIEGFYQKWLKKEDNAFMELQEYVEYELEVRIFGKMDGRKDEEDGNEQDKAA